MSYLEELLPAFRKGAKIRCKGWDENAYIEMKKGVGFVSNNRGRKYIFTYEDFNHACWELYKEPEPNPDWDYIIENKCPCWFRDFTWDNYKLSFLAETYINGGETRRFLDTEDTEWLRCIPIRKDEITFYEDRENT